MSWENVRMPSPEPERQHSNKSFGADYIYKSDSIRVNRIV